MALRTVPFTGVAMILVTLFGRLISYMLFLCSLRTFRCCVCVCVGGGGGGGGGGWVGGEIKDIVK